MILVDRALAKRQSEGKPIRVALVGAGYMGRGIALQLLSGMPGYRLVAVANRTLENAARAYRDAGVESPLVVESAAALQRAIEAGRYAITQDPRVVCEAGAVEAVIEATGEIEYGCGVALAAIDNGKHVILMNAEVDASVGPILKARADAAGVVYTYTDGDEPGVAMNLYRFVASTGYRPVLMGQIKGFLDRYRNPETQRGFAEKHKQNAAMVASFADGSKLAIESAIMGNATGFVPGKRGMFGHAVAHVNDLMKKFDPADFARGGWVDFALGAAPHTGAFVMAHDEHPTKARYMSYFKMGDGPFYMFYTPYHLPHVQLPHSVARAVLFGDATLAPRGAPVCDTVAMAKRDLRAGERLDGMGGFTCYGLVDSYARLREEDALPIALSVDCVLLRDVGKDQPIAVRDVRLPAGRLCDRLREEQTRKFAPALHSAA